MTAYSHIACHVTGGTAIQLYAHAVFHTWGVETLMHVVKLHDCTMPNYNDLSFTRANLISLLATMASGLVVYSCD